MPIINCPECSAQVSTLSPACVHCGAPFAPVSTAPIRTVQMTSKPLKAQVAVSNVVMLVGVILCGLAVANGKEFEIFSGITVAGMVWRALIAVLIWWNHG